MTKYPKFDTKSDKFNQLKNNIYLTNNIITAFPENNDQTSSPNSHLLKTFFDFTYQLYLTPFKFKFVEESSGHPTPIKSRSTVKLHFNRVQQFICILAHSLMVFEYISETRMRTPAFWNHQNQFTTNYPHPSVYFRLVAHIARIFFKFVFLKIVWRNGQDLLDMILLVENNRHYQVFRHRCWVHSKKFSILLCSFFTVNALANIIFWINVDWNELTMDLVLRRYIAAGRFYFGLEDKQQHNPNWAPEWEDTNQLDIVLAILTFFAICYRQFGAYLADGFILGIAIFLWAPVTGFKKLVADQCGENGGDAIKTRPEKDIISNYTLLKQLSRRINVIMSRAVLFFMGEALFNYSTNMNDLFVAKDTLTRYRNSIFFLNFAVVLYFAGSICKIVEEAIGQFAAAITATEDDNPYDRIGKCGKMGEKLTVLLHEAKSHIVSLSGHIFVLDYTTIFNCVATMVTYFVICSTSE